MSLRIKLLFSSIRSPAFPSGLIIHSVLVFKGCGLLSSTGREERFFRCRTHTLLQFYRLFLPVPSRFYSGDYIFPIQKPETGGKLPGGKGPETTALLHDYNARNDWQRVDSKLFPEPFFRLLWKFIYGTHVHTSVLSFSCSGGNTAKQISVCSTERGFFTTEVAPCVHLLLTFPF